MSEQIVCGTPGRRRLVGARDGTDGQAIVHGIDFVEVVDKGAPSEALRQRLIVVRCFHPVATVGLGVDNARIEGGVRVSPVQVLGLGSLPDLVAAPTGPFAGLGPWLTDLQTRIASDPTDDPTNWLVLNVSPRGDASTYTLRLVAGADVDAPPAGFDRLLSAVPFSFKVECPSDFDCAPPAPPSEGPAPGPVIDYLARDYASFRGLLLDRLSTTLPAWTERSAADLGVTLVEILAYAADQVSYHQDAVATEAYLGTSRLRPSVRRHARLLDYSLHEGCNARAWVQIQVNTAVTGGAVPQGTPILGDVPGGATIGTARIEYALGFAPAWFETLHELAVLTPAHNAIAIHTWGDDECCLMTGATGAALVDGDTPSTQLQLAKGDVIVLEQRDPDLGDDPALRHAVRLVTDPVRSFDDVTGNWVCEVTWHDDDALPFELCLAADRVVVSGNIVLAGHGRQITEELDEVDDATNWEPSLPATDLGYRVPYDHEVAVEESATAAVEQDPREALPDVSLVDSTGEPWTPVRDLLASVALAAEFVAEASEDRSTRLRFGDERQGRRPAVGQRFVATWRDGNGAGGNVGAEALCRIVSDTLGDAVDAVRNPIAATGGTDPEPLEQVRLHAPAAFRTQERAVTEADWTDVCTRHPEIQRAVATIRWTGSWHTVFVSVDRVGGRPVDDEFVDDVLGFLEPYRLAGYDLEVEPPVFVPLDVAMSVCVGPGHYREHVLAALHERLGTGVLRDGRQAFFHPDAHTFGGSVYLSAIVAAAMEVAGVEWVDVRPDLPDVEHRFRRLHDLPAGDGLRAGVLRMGRLEIARLDHDPNLPENGRLRFDLRGGA